MWTKNNHPKVAEKILEWLQYDGDPRRPSAPKLNKREVASWERYQTIMSKVLKEGLSWRDAMVFITKTYGISESQYWKDVRGIGYIFPQIVHVTRELQRMQLYEMSMKTWQLAAKNQDAKGMAQALRVMVQLGGFDKEEPNHIDPEKLNPGLYMIVLDSKTEKTLNKLAAAETIDLTKAVENAEYIELDTEGADKEGD